MILMKPMNKSKKNFKKIKNLFMLHKCVVWIFKIIFNILNSNRE